MKKISVIVPVYNVEKYIQKCISSIINQIYKELEIIIVNDGTKDNSIKIVEEKFKDSRIIILNKENGGLSSARNEGLKIATGDYISFVDSDDWIDINLYKNIVENLIDEDIIIFNYLKVEGNDYPIIKLNDKKLKDFNKGYLFYKTTDYACWNKLYKREYLENIKPKFLEGIIYEDIFWGMETLYQTNKVKFLNIPGYYYRINRNGSILNTLSDEKEDKALNKIRKNMSIFLESNKIEKTAKLMGEIELIILGLRKKNVINLVKLVKVDKLIKEIFISELSNLEKATVIKEIQDIFGNKKIQNIIGLDIFETFYIKNKFLNFKSLKRELLRRIKSKI